MAQEDNRSLKQIWIEFQGRQNEPPPIDFGETSILTQPTAFRVWLFGGYYLPLPAMTAAIVTSPSGQKMVFSEGGYKNLQNGAYTLQYVDLHKRTLTFSITDTTLDGSKVSLAVSMNYKVHDPVEIANIAKPLDAFLAACEAAIRKVIKTHNHHEIIGEPDNERILSDDVIFKSVKEQVGKNQACRAFLLMDVVIKERVGDPKIIALQQQISVQEKESVIQREGVVQQQEIAEEQQGLALIKAETESLIQELQATTEADRSEILERARRLSVELETLPRLAEWQNAQVMRKLDVIEKALETLIQTQTIVGFPRNADDIRLLQNIIHALTESVRNLPMSPSEPVRPVNESRSTIINLLSPKNKKGK